MTEVCLLVILALDNMEFWHSHMTVPFSKQKLSDITGW